MKIRYQIFLGFALILSLGFYFLVSWIFPGMNIQPKKAMEESLVDTSHILASFLEQKVKDNNVSTVELRSVLDQASRRELSARIYELNKTAVDLGVYVTDKNGIVIFHATDPAQEGENYYHWRDVYRTLHREYGARTTRVDPDDPVSSIAYVGAPIYSGGEIIGVCSVFKPWASIHSFTKTARRKIIIAAVIGFVVTIILSYLISLWITRPIRRLTRYAHGVKDGKKAALPDLGQGEVRVLGEAFEKMKDALEGKEYIDRYTQNLTHQLKGPLSSIRGAAELLQEKLPKKDREKFIANIEKESARMQLMVDRLLQLTALEKRKELENVEIIDLKEIIAEIVESFSPLFDKKAIRCINNIRESYRCKGERFLIKQAVENLFQNAIEFTPAKGEISVDIERSADRLLLKIKDTGIGIPEYALAQVFDKFYSLPRPDTRQKSSGLGLTMVKEIALLHGGDIVLENNQPTGAAAIFSLPAH